MGGTKARHKSLVFNKLFLDDSIVFHTQQAQRTFVVFSLRHHRLFMFGSNVAETQVMVTTKRRQQALVIVLH